MEEVLELIAKYPQNRVKGYKEDEIKLDEIRNNLRNLSAEQLKNVLYQIVPSPQVPEEIKKEVTLEYWHRGGKPRLDSKLFK